MLDHIWLADHTAASGSRNCTEIDASFRGDTLCRG
jgi:hypothetical protein